MYIDMLALEVYLMIFFISQTMSGKCVLKKKNISRLTCALMHEEHDDTAVQNGCDTYILNGLLLNNK